MSTAFLVVAILSALWGVAAWVRIAIELDRRGIKVNMLLARLYVFRYLSQYKSVTLAETGKVGPLYHSYITSMVLALAFALIGLVLRAS